MQNTEITAEFAKETIRKAFKDEPYPGDENLVLDNCWECEDYAQFFRGKHWTEINVASIQCRNDSLFFFSPEARRFFLPAFLFINIDEYYEADLIADSTVWWFVPNENETEQDSSYQERVAGFSTEQQKAILLFLEFLLQTYPDEYFNQEPQKIEILRNLWQIDSAG